MKLTDLYKDADAPQEPGTYAGVRFSPETVKALREYAKSIKVPKILPDKEFHTTLLYSKKPLPNYTAKGKYARPMQGTPHNLESWPNSDKSKNVLVLTYRCPELYKRHHMLSLMHGATYDFDIYKPHVTLSYDVGKFDVNNVPLYEGPLEIIKEYKEDANE